MKSSWGGLPLNVLMMGTLNAKDRSLGGELTALARDSQFDLAPRLSNQMLEAFRAAGCAARDIPVKRRARGEPRPIGRDELPEESEASVLLDLTVPYAGLATGQEFAPYEPALAVSYRLVSPTGELLQTSRIVHYNRPIITVPGSLGREPQSGLVQEMPFIPADQSCRFRFRRASEEGAKIWQCFDDALRVAAAQIAKDIDLRQLAGCPL